MNCQALPEDEELQKKAKALVRRVFDVLGEPSPADEPESGIADPIHPPEASRGPPEERSASDSSNQTQPPSPENTPIRRKYDLRGTLQLVDGYLNNFPEAIPPAQNLMRSAMLAGYCQGLELYKNESRDHAGE